MKEKKIEKGHQGDVQFRRVDTVPDGYKKSTDRNIAYGEVSGHVHVLTGKADIFRGEDGGICAVVGDEGCTLQHTLLDTLTKERLASPSILQRADHYPVQLPRGIYLFKIQKAYDPFADVYKKVID